MEVGLLAPHFLHLCDFEMRLRLLSGQLKGLNAAVTILFEALTQRQR
jgi:hypothetical protein